MLDNGERLCSEIERDNRVVVFLGVAVSKHLTFLTAVVLGRPSGRAWLMKPSFSLSCCYTQLPYSAAIRNALALAHTSGFVFVTCVPKRVIGMYLLKWRKRWALVCLRAVCFV